MISSRLYPFLASLLLLSFVCGSVESDPQQAEQELRSKVNEVIDQISDLSPAQYKTLEEELLLMFEEQNATREQMMTLRAQGAERSAMSAMMDKRHERRRGHQKEIKSLLTTQQFEEFKAAIREVMPERRGPPRHQGSGRNEPFGGGDIAFCRY